jgi:ribose transport system permease protein
VLIAAFGTMSPRFLSAVNFVNIVIQASHIGIVAIGMTFVLLVGGIDLSVGANMYVVAAVLGLFLQDLPLSVSFPLVIGIGVLFGWVNAWFITRLRVPAFIVTLSTLFVGRGIALYFSGNKMVGFSPSVLSLGRASYFGVPSAIWAFAIVFVVAWLTLSQTTFGRQVYAVGADPEASAKAGIDVRRILVAVYCIAGGCAAIGGLVSLSQVAVASSTFGFQKEFPVIAATVLGGTSLFGGRGGVLGTVFGAVLIQTVENGLVMTNADPYLYPLVISAIIFVAVLVDSSRSAILERLERRQIRVERA